jgi:hypothetical protein
MHPLTVQTIPAEIQDVLSDSDWNGSRPWAVRKPQEMSVIPRRSLKPTLRTFARVCRQWRESTLARQSCWVTRLSIGEYGSDPTGGQRNLKQFLYWAEKTLEATQSGDIDFCVVLLALNLSPEVFQHFVGWMDHFILSISDRIRKCEMVVDARMDGPEQHLQVLFDRLVTRPWPRLQVLRLKSFRGLTEMEFSGYLSAPKLHLATFFDITWKDQPFPLPHNGVSTLNVIYESKAVPIDPRSPDLPTFIAALPPALFTSLSRLIIHLRNRHPPSEGLPELPFTQLLELKLYQGPPESAWVLLKSLRAPLLAKLTIEASEKLGKIPPEPIQFKSLHELRRLHLDMSACWFLPILMALPARERISTLIMKPITAEVEDINHRTLREKFFSSPMQFEGLRYLRYKQWCQIRRILISHNTP